MLARSLTTIAASLAIAAGAAAPLDAQQHDHAGDAHQVGRVAFATSCAAAVTPRFEQAVAMLHSFWFEQAQAAFEEVAAKDPACAMAQWGVAMTLLGNPMARVSPSPERLAQALAASERAAALGATATERERAYIDAVLALYRDFASKDHFARMKLHEDAMKRVYDRFSDDPEAAIFYSRAVIANAPPTDLTFSRQLAAAAILEPLFISRPEHPGLAHYIIHAFDAPAVANHGLDAARRYAAIAPDAPHALHMPSHIFTRLGYWDESIETNDRSAKAEPNPNAAVHPMDYMVYAYLQQGRDQAAGEVVNRATLLPDRFYGGVLGYNFTAMPARFALERGRWADAAKLTLPTGAAPHVEAITRFARAIGAARAGNVAAAEPEVAALAGLSDKLAAQNDAYWKTIVDAQRLAAAAWSAQLKGDAQSATRLARQAADLEETVEKHPVTPGPLLPARELEGDLLLELRRPADALLAYEKTLVREPRRARALFGAARAAELAGNATKASDHYRQLLELMNQADADRPELQAARSFLGRNTGR
jgi:tetratricopeptide (TPR) repeat protein